MSRVLVSGYFFDPGKDDKPVRRTYAYTMVTGPESREICDRILDDPSKQIMERINGKNFQR